MTKNEDDEPGASPGCILRNRKNKTVAAAVASSGGVWQCVMCMCVCSFVCSSAHWKRAFYCRAVVPILQHDG